MRLYALAALAVAALVAALVGTAYADQLGGNYGLQEMVPNGAAFTQSGNITFSNANGPLIKNSASSATVGTLCPDQASSTACIGGTGGDVEIITSGNSRMNFDTAGVITTDERIQITNGDLSISDTTNGSTNVAMFGTGSDFRMGYATTDSPDSMRFGVAQDSRAIILMEQADWATDYAHALATHPTLFTHTSNTTVTEYLATRAVGTQTELFKTLTESSATSIVQIPVAANTATGGTVTYTVFATDATDTQSRSGSVRFTTVNKAATETCGMTNGSGAADASITETEDGNAVALSAGTLTYAITCSTSPTNAVDIQISATSSLTQTLLRAYYTVTLTGPGEPLPQ